MKPFATYQHLNDELDTARSIKEKDSKFWNEGKWDNFVAPFLPENCEGLTLVEMGCNAGLFLKLAKERGFSQVVGVEASSKAFSRGIAYRDKVGGEYDIQRRYMERSLKHMPMADYTIFVNAHYYMHIAEWLKYVDALAGKTHYCILVTDKKRERFCVASPDIDIIKRYFKHWKLVGHIPELQPGNDPHPRRLQSLCFESPFVKRMPVDEIDCGNHVQGEYYRALDKNKNPLQTRYFKILEKYRKRKWSREQIIEFMQDKVKLYESMKKDGLIDPIIINSSNRVLDGNHRFKILEHLGHKSVLVRRI